MNKEITIYELLGLMKDDKAPKRIKYKGKIYVFAGDDYSVNDDLEEWLLTEYDYLTTLLNEKVEIIEEDEGIELLDTTQDNTLIIMECYTGILEKALDWNFNILKEKINELSKEVNKLRKKNNEE